MRVEDSYTVNPNTSIVISNGQTYNAAGQSFQAAYGGKLKQATFKIQPGGSPTGNCCVKLYAHTGTYGTSSAGTGEPLATSDNVDASKISGTPATVTFTFSTPYKLTKGAYYCLVVEYAAGDANNKLYLSLDDVTKSHAGNELRRTAAGEWSAVNTKDVYFIAYSTLSKKKRIGYTKQPRAYQAGAY